MERKRQGSDGRSRRRRWLRLRPVHLAVGFIAIAATVLSGVTATGASLARLSTCNDATFIAIAGSGQYYKSDTDLSISPQLQTAHQSFVARLAGRRSLALKVLDYPAPSVDVLFANVNLNRPLSLPGTIQKNVSTYLAGKDTGVAQLWATYTQVRASCPSERIVLAGYSQGAMVVHQFLEELNATTDTAGKAAVRGVILLADPDRVHHSLIVDFGDAPFSSYGVCDLVSKAVSCTSPDRLTDIPGRFDSVTIGVCFSDDPVCDTSDVVREFIFNTNTGRRALISLVQRVHASYAYRSQTSLAAARIAQLVAAR